MKISILILAWIFFHIIAFSQSTCPNPNATPAVTQPTNTAIVASTCSTLVVKWQGNPNQTYCVSATWFNDNSGKNDTAAGTNVSCSAGQSCTATIPVVSGAQVTWSVQAIAADGSASYPVISVLQHPIAACGGSGVTFCGRVLLQGAYDTDSAKMTNTLNTLGILQAQAASQPYNNAVFGYAGAEKVGDGFFASYPDITDWILIELRDPNAPSVVVARRAAFVKQDGTILDTSGYSTQVFFPGVPTGSYYVAIRHRNHLGIRTAEPVDFGCSNHCYDFTTGGFQSFKNQSYTSPVQTDTLWMMRGGDANQNGSVKYNGPANDQNQILNIKLKGSLSAIIDNVYAPEDVNMNGNIRWAGPGNDQTFLLNVTLSGLLSLVLSEQF